MIVHLMKFYRNTNETNTWTFYLFNYSKQLTEIKKKIYVLFFEMQVFFFDKCIDSATKKSTRTKAIFYCQFEVSSC